MQNYILTSGNDELVVTGYRGNATVTNLGGVPLGTVGGSTTTEIGVKTLILEMPALPAGTAVIGHVIVDSGVLTTVTTVTAVTAITNPLPAGTNLLGKTGPSQSAAAPTNTATTPFTVLTTDADVFTLAAGERGFIQNHDDAVLNFKYGTGCSTSSLSGRLKACSAADDGSGGYTYIQNWIGVVSVAAATGSPRFSAWKI